MLADPEECSVSDRLSPGFDHILQTWETSSSLYGDTIARCFQSKDGSLEYLIFQNHDGGSWVGGIECASAKVTSTGLRAEFIEPGSLTTPLYEYHIPGRAYQDGRKSGGFWGDPNMIKGPYIRMDDYTSRIPMLRELNQRYGK